MFLSTEKKNRVKATVKELNKNMNKTRANKQDKRTEKERD